MKFSITKNTFCYNSKLETISKMFLIVLLIISLIAFFCILYRVWNYTVDDSFITFRYANNISKGWGPTFNHDHPRAEGYTSILWTFLLSIPHFANIPIVISAKIIGLICTLLTVLLIFFSIIKTEIDDIPKDIVSIVPAIILFVSFPYTAIHTVSGMETALAGLLYTAVIGSALSIKEDMSCKWFLPLLCLLLGLVRPEANLFNGIFLWGMYYTQNKDERKKSIILILLLYVIPGILFFIWRWNYYGYFFPLPFYIKSNEACLEGVVPFLIFITNMDTEFIIPIILLAFFKPKQLSPLLIALGFLIIYLTCIKHIMDYGNRYFYPIIPAYSIIAGLGFGKVMTILKNKYKLLFKLLLIPTLLFVILEGFKISYAKSDNYIQYSKGLENAHILLGKTLSKIEWKSIDPILVIGDAGAVPYYSGLKTIDSVGLNDPVIAKGTEKERIDYIIQNNPTIIVFRSESNKEFKARLAYERPLFQTLVNKYHYYDSKISLKFADKYFLWIVLNPDSNDRKNIEYTLNKGKR